MNPDNQTRWLALHCIPGVGARTLLRLLQHFQTVENIFTAPRAELLPLMGGKSAAVDAILAGADAANLERELAWLEDDRHHLLTFDDESYPALLRQMADPPMVLFVAGDKSLLAQPQIAIVGSRNPTPTGAENAHAFSATLARAGLAITSGMALGIDAAAHKGALAARGRTIAVTGTGIDRVYPARHRELAHQIAENGALVSEFPLGTEARRENFPQRNRLISGLSLGTLVVEAALGSGSLITAKLAADQGREVFAIPGSIHSPLSRGCHALIRQGAKLVETAQDIIEELGPLALAAEERRLADREKKKPVNDPSVANLLGFLDHDPVSVDTLVERSGLTTDTISSMLLKMELLGLVAPCAGGKYLRR